MDTRSSQGSSGELRGVPQGRACKMPLEGSRGKVVPGHVA